MNVFSPLFSFCVILQLCVFWAGFGHERGIGWYLIKAVEEFMGKTQNTRTNHSSNVALKNLDTRV